MDLETYLLIERKNIQVERQRLSARRNIETTKCSGGANTWGQQPEKENECPALDILNKKDILNNKNPALNNEIITKQSSNNITASNVNYGAVNTNTICSEDKTENMNSVAGFTNNVEGEQLWNAEVEWLKFAKDTVNNKELSAVAASADGEDTSTPASSKSRRRNQDDMEQWVTDTFYSYFPGFNNEYQKRQNYLRERQREHQRNFIKHQYMNPPLSKQAAAAERSKNAVQENINTLTTTRSSNSTTSNTTMSHATTDKTDLEIIVNNPNYVPPKFSNTTITANTRPGTTRHKLLQDLRHTELSNIISNDGITERNQRSAELETERKKDYQRELMQQIEEKRRSIEMLREKERRQDEALTKRLQEQLKTIQLEEQLEKERKRADKARYDSEQNRLMREHLLAKLENDTKLLYANENSDNAKNAKLKQANNDADKDVKYASAGDSESNNNKVYKYFSNSARHEYRRGRPLPAEVQLDLELPQQIRDAAESEERECFHLSEKACPMCDAPLKNYESCCLRCQSRLSLKLNVNRKTEMVSTNVVSSGNAKEARASDDDVAATARLDDEETVQERGFSLVCLNCERMYTMCGTCLAQNDVCRACHRKLNVCMNCRRTLCSFCLEEIACGRDAERRHINDADSVTMQHSSYHKNESPSERSFRVLDLNYESSKDNVDECTVAAIGEVDNLSPPSFSTNNDANYKSLQNNLREDSTHPPPYSINIERNSIFHSDYEVVNMANKSHDIFEKLPKFVDKQLSFDFDSSQTDKQSSLERVRKETDKRMSRYLKNYGDLAFAPHRHSAGGGLSKSEYYNRSTQTTPDSIGRRDVVLHEEHNLSMPLLHEMPKWTRHESSNFQENTLMNNQRKIEQLKCKWEIPAVQKLTISKTYPLVFTQVGAVRKQLQAERILNNNY